MKIRDGIIIVKYKGLGLPVTYRRHYEHRWECFLGKRFVGEVRTHVTAKKLKSRVRALLKMLHYEIEEVTDKKQLLEIILDECFDEQDRDMAENIIILGEMIS